MACKRQMRPRTKMELLGGRFEHERGAAPGRSGIYDAESGPFH